MNINFKNVSLKQAVDGLEDGIITVSGPALAISGIIAGVDLVTGGHILQSVSWLALAWAICLLLTLDFQVLALGARAHRVYLSTDKSTGQKVFEIILAVIIAMAVSYVSIQMQSIIARVNSTTPALSIEAATLQMGINPIALIWERSALVLLLIFLSGWFREITSEGVPLVAITVPPASQISDEALNTILERLSRLDRLEQSLQAQVNVTVSEAPVSLIEPPVLPDEMLTPASGTDEQVSETPGLKAQLEQLLVLLPDISTRQAAGILGKPTSTVGRHIQLVRKASSESGTALSHQSK